MNIIITSIAWLYYFLLFSVPLVLYPHTSEIFEFNKIIVAYLGTNFIVFLWIVRMIQEKRFIFKRTKLDIPILILLTTLAITTLFSIDPHTSFYGYYTRFHGGLLSYISYSLLYWGFVSNLNKKHVIKSVHVLLISSILVSIYGILQHFGIDKEIWIQNVQGRIFSTLGQPNWLAAWIVAITPLSWIYIHHKSSDKKFDKKRIFLGNYWMSVIMFFVYYLVLSYTRSRSGFIALSISAIIYFTTTIYVYFTEKKISLLLKKVTIPLVLIIIYSIYSGTVFTPSLSSILFDKEAAPSPASSIQQNKPENNDVPEVNFRSTDIRLIVWEGAIDVWKDNPILGTGPETFAYSYYQYRPEEHNLVSEWDFLYNKAHNEYLNQLATTGMLGTLGYLFFHLGVMYILFINFRKNSEANKYLHLALLSGFVSMIVTNFAGFSVVPVGLLMFLFPAFSIISLQTEDESEASLNFDSTQKIYLAIATLVSLFVLIRTINYWRADLHFASAQIHNDTQNFQDASQIAQKAIEFRSSEHVYWQELSEAEAGLALLLLDVDEDLAIQMARSAQQHTEQAEDMSPYDVNTIRKQASVYLKLSYIDPDYLIVAERTVARAVDLAPTEAKLIYNLGVIRLRMGDYENGVNTLQRAIEMRPMYANARYALALAYIDIDRPEDASEQLNYILGTIDPNHKKAQEELDKLNEGDVQTSVE